MPSPSCAPIAGDAPGCDIGSRSQPRASGAVLASGVAGTASAALGLFLAAHHPLGSGVALALFGAAALAFALWPLAWLTALPALLPVSGLAPWSGWIGIEELDLLVLAAAAGGCARVAVDGLRGVASAIRSQAAAGQMQTLVALGVLLMAASIALSAWRGILDAGGFEFGWTEGYHEPMNSLRLAKPFFAALLLWPLWSRAQRTAPDDSAARLGLGLMLGLFGAALAALWERLAYTGLLDFSSDYRTTALFWEMHVGGAALDGFLALTLPFALRELLVARSNVRWIAAAAVMTLAGYACLTTFSRMVYAAVPIELALLVALWWRASHRADQTGQPARGSNRSLPWAIALAGAFATGAWHAFPAGGYRSLLALLGAAAVLLLQGASLSRLGVREWLAGMALGGVLGAALWALSTLLPKGVYIVHAVATLATLGWILAQRSGSGSGNREQGPATHAVVALAGLVTVLIASAAVALEWGSAVALRAIVPTLLGMLVLGAFASCWPQVAWPAERRFHGALLVGLMLIGGAVGVSGGGAYMSGRFATSDADLAGRIDHWRRSLDLLDGDAQWLFGKGLGRYPAATALAAGAHQQVGDYRVLAEPGNRYLVLSAGTTERDWNEYLRVMQRVEPPAGAATVKLDVRTREPVNVHFEVCAKHLLYDGGCQVANADIAPKDGRWQPLQITLAGAPLTRGAWYAPRLMAFAIVTVTSGGRVEYDNLRLAGADGRNLLANGDFEAGMARWFFTSDRVHLPWHAKNLALHTLIEQGALGLALLIVLGAAGWWRVAFGAARGHPLAPALAAAITGFAIIGVADSLLDIPRIAWLFWLLLLIALTLRGPAAIRTPRAAALPSRRQSALSIVLLASMVATALPDSARADTIRVGPQREVKSISLASHLARDGDTVLVDAGDYVADVAVWTQQRLTLRAVDGRARLVAAGAAAEGKAIWVVRGGTFDIEGFDFEGAAVPDRNGAGIRFERGWLRVRDCRFMRNESGILTGNDPATVLEVEASEFADNLQRDGYNHLLYAGTIARLEVRASYFHHARSGHLLKSRAAVSRIHYSRLTDEAGGNASYELEFANGGDVEVVGSIVAQGPATENRHIVSYGAEGYRWPVNALRMVHNTLVDEMAEGGVFLRVSPGAPVALTLAGNLLAGPGSAGAFDSAAQAANPRVALADLASVRDGDYRLRAASPAAQRGRIALDAVASPLRPMSQYRHPRATEALDARGLLPGALQDNAGPPRR